MTQLQACKQEAKDQLQELKHWINEAHSDIFFEWKYIGIIAFTSVERKMAAKVNPFLAPQEERFVIYKDDLDDDLNSWWAYISKTNPREATESAYNSYVEYMKRIVGLSKFGCDMRMGLKECSRVVRGKTGKILTNFETMECKNF